MRHHLPPRLAPLLLSFSISACATGSTTPDEMQEATSPEPPSRECDMWDISEAVGRATPAFQNCYAEGVDENPTLTEKGTIKLLLQWHVHDDGTTAHPSIVRSNTDAPVVHRCLKQKALELDLPDLADHDCLARHGFAFSPEHHDDE